MVDDGMTWRRKKTLLGLTFLDLFATSTQQTAVSTAADRCRNIPEDSFATVRDVMPTLDGV
jgi:E3 ubiquitin-protein ligase TRIP12